MRPPNPARIDLHTRRGTYDHDEDEFWFVVYSGNGAQLVSSGMYKRKNDARQAIESLRRAMGGRVRVVDMEAIPS